MTTPTPLRPIPHADPDDAVAVLSAVRDFLTPETWCRVSLAEDQDGRPVMPENPGACRFCLIGAIIRVSGRTFVPTPVYEALDLSLPYDFTHVSDFNDVKNLPEIHALIDHAIELAREARAS